MAKLGFIGLGVMGSQMVNRLLSKGHTVTGHNRTRAKAQWLVEKGLLIKDVAQPARVSLTGRSASPGLFEVLEALGREESLARLEKGKALSEGAPAS